MKESSVVLRPYQKEALGIIEEAVAEGIRRQLISMPTGAGKTICFGNFIARMRKRALIIAHTGELLSQAQDKLRMIAPEISSGLVCATHKEFEAQVVISSIQSACRPKNLEALRAQNFEVVVIDEAHHAAASSYREVIEALGCSSSEGPLLLGFTGTAFRGDGLGLGEVFDKVVYEIEISELIEQGYLVKPKGTRIRSDLDLSLVETFDGDFKAKSLSEVMNTEELRKAVVEAYKEHAAGRSALTFCCSIAHAEALTDAFTAEGIRCKAVSGRTPRDEREQILQDYAKGKIEVVTNCSILTEGFDAPITEVIIIARPTKSRGLFTQMAGRALRLFPNKSSALILDFGCVSHTLANMAVLLRDKEEEEVEEKEEDPVGEKMRTYPPQLHQKLKFVAVHAELFAESQGFAWSKDWSGRHCIQGTSNELVRIDPEGQDRFAVRLYEAEALKEELGAGLSFDYAVEIGTAFVKKNRRRFRLADMGATWRKHVISDGQLKYLRKKGYTKGIKDLTKGQAALIIGSGIIGSRQ